MIETPNLQIKIFAEDLKSRSEKITLYETIVCFFFK